MVLTDHGRIKYWSPHLGFRRLRRNFHLMIWIALSSAIWGRLLHDWTSVYLGSVLKKKVSSDSLWINWIWYFKPNQNPQMNWLGFHLILVKNLKPCLIHWNWELINSFREILKIRKPFNWRFPNPDQQTVIALGKLHEWNHLTRCRRRRNYFSRNKCVLFYQTWFSLRQQRRSQRIFGNRGLYSDISKCI